MNIFSSAPNTPGLKLAWSDGWVEDFPEDEFAEECEDRPRRIWMYRQTVKRCLVDYTLSVRDNEAYLNYGGHFREANSADDRDIYIGTTRIRFTDDTRSIVKDVSWKDEGKSRFVEYDIPTSWSQSSINVAFEPPSHDHRKRRRLNSVLRPGQLRFRRTLLNNYGNTCCMTGAIIEETIEAAHIMPYLGTEYDHPENGLLLRADLHRLFDSLLISVNPETLEITLSPVIKNDPHYSSLNQSKLSFSDNSFKPSHEALRDHWDRFNEKNISN
jgi:hypothetical protein